MQNLEAGIALVNKFSSLLDLSGEEKSQLMALQSNTVQLEADSDLISFSEPIPFTYIIQDGWAYSYKLLANGRMQVLNYHLRGDFIGLYATVFRYAENSVRSLTDLAVCRIDPQEIIEVFRNTPRLAAAICWAAGRDGAILGEQITRIGRRTAYERTGHLILELLRRMESVYLAEDNAFEFPVTQELLADTLGLTPVHINRTLRTLKSEGKISYSKNHIKVLDRKALSEATGFDPFYLEQTALPQNLEGQIDG